MQDTVYAYQVKTVLKSGAEFDAVVIDKPVVKSLQERQDLDIKSLDPESQLTLHYMYGMNGYMKVRLKNVNSVSRLTALGQEDLNTIRGRIQKRIDVLNENEKVRLAKLREERERKRKEEQEMEEEQRKQAEEEAKQKAEAAKIQWITRFPPEEGWGPDRKQEIYLRSMAIGIFPNKEEQTFLDHYNEWLNQYAIWEKMKAEEEARKAEEAEAAEAETKEGTEAKGSGEEDKGSGKEEEKETSASGEKKGGT